MTPQILLNLLTHGLAKVRGMHACPQRMLAAVCCPLTPENPPGPGRPQMSQIHLLVFDEAHHCKKRHPYCRIMEEFYHCEDALLEGRPSILGMTSSPADAGSRESQVRVVWKSCAAQRAVLHCSAATLQAPSPNTSSNALQVALQAKIARLEAILDARVVTVVNRHSVEEVRWRQAALGTSAPAGATER